MGISIFCMWEEREYLRTKGWIVGNCFIVKEIFTLLPYLHRKAYAPPIDVRLDSLIYLASEILADEM